MAFLDWILNRQEQEPEKVQPRSPTPGKGVVLGADSRPSTKPLEQTPSDVQARVEKMKATMEKASQHLQDNPVQDNAAPAEGASLHEKRMARAMRYVDASTRPKSPSQPETSWPRPPASWER